MSAAGSIQPQDAKLISTTVSNLSDETEDLSHKTNQLQLNDSSGTAASSHQNFKIRNNTYRKSQQMNVNRQYQMPYSPYPYSMLNSASLLTNTPIPMIPQNYMYPTSYQNNSNLYSSRNNQNNYFLTNSQKRAYNLQKLWPNNLKKQPNTNVSEKKKSEDKTEIICDESTKKTSISESNPIKQETGPNDNNTEKIFSDYKTPMCLINELVRFNKIKHEYVLLDEIGPAHKKVFYIMLKLGIETENEESYTAQGSSIKKTQHATAELALKQTKFKIPVKRDKTVLKTPTPEPTVENQQTFKPKEIDLKRKSNSKSNPPTVKLNTLAMKLGLVANYTHSVTSFPNNIDFNLDLSLPQQNVFVSNQTFDYNYRYLSNEYTNFQSDQFNNGAILYNKTNEHIPINSQQVYSDLRRSHQSYQIAQQIQRPKQIINVKLSFADKEFKGQGMTLQQAKHDAASQALEFFTNTENFLQAKSLSASAQNITIKAYRPPQFYQQQEQLKKEETVDSEPQKTVQINKVTDEKTILNSDVKSEVQLVYEYAFYLKKSVDFDLIQESGPSHIKKFVTKCILGNREVDKTSEFLIPSSETNCFPIETIGDGNSKKQSKKYAAAKMLVILKEKFEPLLQIASSTKTQTSEIKSDSLNTETSQQLNDANKKHRKSKAKNITKIKKTSPEYGKGSINPISRLMQIQQAKKEREPLFELVPQTKKRNQEFIIQVTIESTGSAALKCDGRGSTKKIAKQKAAEAMLVKLGYQARQPMQSVLKSTLKLSAQNSIDDQTDIKKDSNPSSPTEKSIDMIPIEKSEKKVKFLEDPNLKSEESTTKLRPKSSLITDDKRKALKTIKTPMNQSQTNHINKQQKIKQIQQIIANNQSKLSGILDQKNLDLVFKIASELLESVPDNINSDKEFYSATAEQILNKNGKLNEDEQEHESEREQVEKKIQFKILNGGLDSINYKKMLEYLADVLSFKVNYQSLLGRDGSVYSYVSLSILPETEKPLNGHGSTHIESSNAAALCALRYLSSKYNQKFISTYTKASLNLRADSTAVKSNQT